MGQEISVRATRLGNVAIFDLDRSLTGQDPEVFHSSPEGDSPPERLARRLWNADGQLTSVHVLSNIATVARSHPWTEESLSEAQAIIAKLFAHYEAADPAEYYESLRAANYNATISAIRRHNEDLWVMRIAPDEDLDPYEPGQYTTLGLGFWEPRADHVMEDFEADPDQLEKLARRSYSVSSSIVDDDGELVVAQPEEVEFYIVQVPPGEEEIPALTPRIFMKDVGDKIFMGRKFTGRYTLAGVESEHNVVFLSTGTGEAPQNIMTAELLRRGHEGRILNVVCVRYHRDLAYLEQQSTVEERFPNYRYEAITTREPENEGNKVYIQDLIQSGRLEEMLEVPLDPQTTHVFLCGNPAMIGLPKWDDDDTMHFPERLGVCELLAKRGFTIDHRKVRGNVHFEEYWKET